MKKRAVEIVKYIVNSSSLVFAKISIKLVFWQSNFYLVRNILHYKESDTHYLN